MRVIKFRAWTGEKMIYESDIKHIALENTDVLRMAKFWCNIPNDCKVLQYIGIKDKHNAEIYEGDFVMGHLRYMRGDGYLPKGYPDRVRVFLQVIIGDGRDADAGVTLFPVGFHPDDLKFVNKRNYREHDYHLQESREIRLKNNKYVWLGVNETLEVVGNIFQHNIQSLKP